MNETASARARILIVDDEPANLKLMRATLVSADYEVVDAASGSVALDLAKALLPDLILLDIAMPDMDGYAVCGHLKNNDTTRNIPVIFVTAAADAQAEARGFAVGAADYVTKPIVLPTVLARVQAHLALSDRQRRLEHMFRDVIEFAPDAFILADMQGKIVQINAQTEQLFGYSRSELIGLLVEVLIRPRKRRAHESPGDTFARQPRRLTAGIGVQCVRKDGTEFPADINLSPMQTNQGRLLMAVVRDVTDRRKAEVELRDSRQRLRELAAQNEAAREEERKHVAREIHDELGQILTALRMDLSLLDMRFSSLDPALADKVSGMKGLIDLAIQGVRNVGSNLRPAALDMGLAAAIEWLCHEFTVHANIPCILRVEEEDIALDETRSVVVFRIVQESLTNVSRYAHASRVDVGLGRRGNELWVEVRDDGQGFDLAAAARKKSFGLLGMRERAIGLGGRVDIVSAPARGTVVGVSIPLALDVVRDAA